MGLREWISNRIPIFHVNVMTYPRPPIFVSKNGHTTYADQLQAYFAGIYRLAQIVDRVVLC